MVLDLGGSGPRPPGGGEGRRPGRPLLYQRVIADIDALVAERGLSPGDLLPTYAELAERSAVSLITVRRALDELERAGKVRRHQGLGTFLARPRIVAEPARAGSLLATLVAPGGTAAPATRLETRVLKLRRGLPSAGLAAALQIGDGAEVWRLRRLRLIEARPAVLETSVIPAALAPDLDRLVSRLSGSLYDLLASEWGLEDAYEEQYLEVTVASKPERRLLGLAARAQVVRIRGLSLDAAGTPFDCFEQLYPATEFAFAIAGTTARHLLPVPAGQDWDVRALPEISRRPARPARDGGRG
jgi:GntR family transcriptional regulator